MPIKTFAELKSKVSGLKPMRVSVASAQDRNVIESLKVAIEEKIIKEPILIGNAKKTEEILKSVGAKFSDYQIIDSGNDEESARRAVDFIRNKDAEILVKGKLETVFYLKAILDKENGIKNSLILSNLTLFSMKSYHKFLSVTDNAIIPLPTLEEKKFIIENTKPLYNALEIDTPKVAVLSALEIINPKIESTVDAACLCQMSERGQISGFMIDGPLSYDTAIDRVSAGGKHLSGSQVAGDPDILLMPNLESANILGKAYKFHGDAESGGLLLGAKVPVVLNSRSDTADRRLNSMIMARAIAEVNRCR